MYRGIILTTRDITLAKEVAHPIKHSKRGPPRPRFECDVPRQKTLTVPADVAVQTYGSFTVLGWLASATMNTTIFRGISLLAFLDTEWTAPGGS